MARKWLPDNVTEWKDRHGKKRYRFRKRGLPEYSFKHAPGSPEFLAEYHAAKNAEKPEVERFAPFTYDALCDSFYRTPKWIDSRASTQATYRGIIERFRKTNGTKDVRKITTGNIEAKLFKMSATPAAANNLRKALAQLHRHAIKLGWRTDNPVTATDAFKKGKGFHCWTNEELDAFDSQWPYGTRERLAKELLLATAMRKTDVLSVGPGNRTGNRLELLHTKNDSATSIPMSAELLRALEGLELASGPYLQTIYGKPYTSTGFYNWFKRACVKAGIPHCSPHGLRKAISRMLAESGATVLEGRAVTGHKTDREFMKYAESANKGRMADRALANLPKRFDNKAR
jgi:integrase